MPNKTEVPILVNDAYTKLADLLTPKSLKGFAEQPVPLDVFIYGKDYLNCSPLSKVQYDFVEAASNIFDSPTFTECIAMIGKGGGKNFIACVTLARIIYQLECLNSPQFYFNLQPNSFIEVMNVSVNARQANMNFFQPFKELVRNSPYFKKIGFNETRDTILFPKNLRAISGNSEQEGLEGFTLIAVVFDEIAGFPISDDISGSSIIRQRDAKTLYNSLRSSTLRFPGVGKTIALSWPRYDGDFIMQLVETRKNDISAYVVAGVPTWIANPTKKREDFEDEYKKDPINADAKYACKPPKSVNRWLNKPEIIDDVFKVTPYVYNSDNQLHTFNINNNYDYVMHIDLGLKHDATGIVVVHSTDVGKVIVDYVEYLVAPAGGEVKFEDIYSIVNILKNRGVKLISVTMDSWQSAEMLQNLKKIVRNSDVVSADRTTAPYDTLKELIYTGKLECDFRHELLVKELKELQLIKGVKVDHLPGRCFTGDTKISLLNGQEICIRELVDKDGFWVYSFDGKNVVAGYGHSCRKTGDMVDVYEITLDNGEKIKATKEHLFMLRDGTYCSVSELKVNTPLMPLYRKLSNNVLVGYELFFNPVEKKWHYTHSTISTFWKSGRHGFVRHHKDFNKRNNYPNNINIIPQNEHMRIHGRELSTATKEKMSASAKDVWKRPNSKIVCNKCGGFILYNRKEHKCIKRMGSKCVCEYCGVTVLFKTYYRHLKRCPALRPERIEEKHNTMSKAIIKCRKKQDIYGKDKRIVLHREEIKHRGMLCSRETIQCLICSTIFVARGSAERTFCSLTCKDVYLSKQMTKQICNHKVVAIKYVGREDVYDFEVCNYHNFAVSAGVFVHNSKDIADALACACFVSVDQYPYKKRITEIADIQEMLITNPERQQKLQPQQQQGAFTVPKWPEQMCMFCRKKDEVVVLDAEKKTYYCRRCNTTFGNL